jgi:hypothetical protein
MAQYDTWTKTKDEITVTVSKAKDQTAGGRLTAFLKWLSEHVVDPGYGQGGSGANRPDNTLPGQGGANRPDQGLPPGQNRPDNTLPGQGGTPPKPDQGLPPSGSGARPDQGLPGSQPGIDNSLPREHIDEIVKLILGKCTSCEVAQPK